MRNFVKYEGRSLMKLMFDVDENNSIVVFFANISAHQIQLASGRIETLMEVLGLYILDIAIIECKFDKYASKWYVKIDKYASKWYVKIDIDNEGKSE